MNKFSPLFIFLICMIGLGVFITLTAFHLPRAFSKEKTFRLGLVNSSVDKFKISDDFDHISPKKSKRRLMDIKDSENPLVYALMITGKDDRRIEFAKKAVMNFDDQDYPNKRLIIVNHHPDPQMEVLRREENGENGEDEVKKNDRLEIRMKKESLGHLRNASLEFVPMNAYWTIWDDDDWRPRDYLSTLLRMIFDEQVDGVTFTTRYEHNLKTVFSWKMTSMKGYPTILCKQNPLIRYKNVDTMEDVDLLESIRKIGLKVFIYHNVDRPDLYVRLVHGNNSSLYINHMKTNVRPRHSESNSYKEDMISQKEKEFVVRSVQQLLNY